MARLRTRIKRTAYLLVALALLFLLLELNHWLPGVWQGGGGGGFHTAGEMGLPDPSRTADEELPADRPEDSTSVEAPTEPPTDWPPKDGVVIKMRGPEGALATGWRLERGLAGGGLRFVRGDRSLWHRRGLDMPASSYIVHVPKGALPPEGEPAPVVVEVVDPATGTPLVGAHVFWTRYAEKRQAKTDARGRAEIEGPTSGKPFRADVWTEGHVTRKGLWLRPRRGELERVTLPKEVHITLRFRWEDRRPAQIQRATVRGPDGTILAKVTGEGRKNLAELSLTLAAHELESASLTVEPVRTDVDGLRVTMPLKDLAEDVTLAEPRTVRIVARDVEGQPIHGADVLVRFDAGEAGVDTAVRPWRTKTNLRGEAHVSLAPGQGCEVIVRRESLGPAARRLRAVDGGDTLAFTLTEGVFIPVRVLDPDGSRRMGTLLARGTTGGVRIEAGAETSAFARLPSPSSTTRVGPLPSGPTELYAHGPAFAGGAGFLASVPCAWQAVIVDARPAMPKVDLKLEQGYPLSLIVEDAFGVPIEGASIELTVTAGGAPHVVPPYGPAWRTGTYGSITLDDLPDRIYEVRISRRGYGTQRLQGIRPGGALHLVTLLRQR